MRKFLLPLLILSFNSIINAQLGSNVGQPTIDLKKIIPATPQSAQLVRVNEITVNAARGVPQISFTLYTASVGKQKIPITISYDASGIKYDDVPSTVGLKWTLQAGGEISRNVNGREDEYYYFANQAGLTSQSYILANWDFSTSSIQTLCDEIGNNTADIFQDEYSYNFLDRSGYFYFRNNKFWDIAAPFTTKVDVDSLNLLKNFRITDDVGNIAYFGYGIQDFTRLTYGGSGYILPYVPPSGLTAWHLTKLHAYNGEEATFEYDTSGSSAYVFTKLLSEAYVYRQPTHVGQYNCNCGTSNLSQSNLTCRYGLNIPKKITTPNEVIQFYYSTTSLNTYKVRLDSITVQDKYQVVVKRFHFKYGSYSTVNLLRLDGVWEMGSANDSILIASFHYKNGTLNSLSNARDIFNYNNGASNTHIISSNDPNCPSTYRTGNRTISSSNISIGNLDTIYYPTTGKAVFYYSPNQSGDTCGPGVRVDSIKYLNSDNSFASQTTYSYSGPQNYYLFSGTVNATQVDADNSLCTVKTFHSEIRFPPANPFYYSTVDIRKKGTIPSATQLIRETYIPGQSPKFVETIPIISKRMYFRSNSLTDTLKTETYTYNTQHIDSLGIDWLYISDPYLPAQIYYLDGVQYDNSTQCNVLYSYVGSNGTIYPHVDQLAKVTTSTTDQNTSSVHLVNAENASYNNYWQKTADSKTNSKGNLDSTTYTYLYTNAGSIASNVTNDNVYGFVNKTTRYTNSSAQLEQSRASYSVHNSHVFPDSFFVTSLTNPEIYDNMITGYDTSDNITEVDNKRGFYSSLLRDYNNQLLVAEATNARLSQVAYTSFEAESKGGWSYSGSVISDATAPTGSKCYNLAGGNITKSGLASATYIVSYWSKSGSYTVNGSSTPTRTGKTIGLWTYYEHEVTGTSITISGGNNIDELRLYPKGAQMITYTYLPLIGIQAQCDVDNRIMYYEYDDFERLRRIRDQDKNILKVIDYEYNQAQNQ